jgi:thymidylate synthase (FAD)
MKAEYIQHMGDDLTVVNAARVSFDKSQTELDVERDTKLIRYLARHAHWTPFSHALVTFRMTAPIFIARQLFKHKVGFTENETSRRYVDSPPEFFIPDEWRGRPVNSKQGSSDEIVTTFLEGDDITESVKAHFEEAETLYNDMLAAGVAPEQARAVLPQAMYTQWYWTGSLAAWARYYKQRIDSHAQKENYELVKQVGEKMEELFPISWKELTQ